jgi:thymidine phosphorylase
VSAELVAAIAAARDAATSPADVAAVVAASTDPTSSDAQLAAWLMAVRLRGLADAAAADLTAAMAASGETLAWPDGPAVVDKHSTGGVGDKTSLVLAPLLAALGYRVPMVSGRSLGLTGGTLDKLEAISGFDVHLDPPAARRALDDAGCFIAAASDRLAPADARLYRLRDVTATIDSVPLIAASILSKKLAAGVRHLVLDVKWGSGAFMGDFAAAERLAATLVALGSAAGMRCAAALCPMDEPLGRAVGNAAEVREALVVLGGSGGAVRDAAVALARRAARLAGDDLDDAAVARPLDDGRAYEAFARMCAAQNASDPAAVAVPAHRVDVSAPRAGRGRFDAHATALAAAALGATRTHPGGPVDVSASVDLHVADGDAVAAGDVIATVGCADATAAAHAAGLVAAAWREVGELWEPAPTVAAWIEPDSETP